MGLAVRFNGHEPGREVHRRAPPCALRSVQGTGSARRREAERARRREAERARRRRAITPLHHARHLDCRPDRHRSGAGRSPQRRVGLVVRIRGDSQPLPSTTAMLRDRAFAPERNEAAVRVAGAVFLEAMAPQCTFPSRTNATSTWSGTMRAAATKWTYSATVDRGDGRLAP